MHAMAWLLVGSIPGVLLGSQMSISVPERSLRLAFSFVLVLSGIKLVGVPHAALIIVVSLCLGALALDVFLVRQWLSREVCRGRREPVAHLDSPDVPRPRFSDGPGVRAARGHDRRLRRHGAAEARAEPDHRGLRDEDLLADL